MDFLDADQAMAKCTSEPVYLFEGVKLECVEERFFNTHVDRTNGVLVIREFNQLFREPVTPKTKLLQNDNFTAHLIPVSASLLQLRIIGSPVCIGCRGDILILQFITANSKYVQFLYVNLTSCAWHMFDDTTQYLNFNIISVSPLECFISPDLNMIILRLPQMVLRPHAQSSALQVVLRVDKSTAIAIPVGTELTFRDHKFLAVGFDPYKPAHRYAVIVDEYCGHIQLVVVDMNNMNTVIKKKDHYIGKKPRALDDDVDDSDEEISTFILQQCSLTFSRSGDVCIVFCSYIDTYAITYIRLVQYSTETLQCINVTETALRHIHVPIGLTRCDLLFPVLSVCDSWLAVWYMKRKTAPVKCVMEVPIQKSQRALKSLARSIILHSVHRCKIELLPVPMRLKMYLRFE